MSKIVTFLGLLAVAGALSACGETPAECAATGAIIGAAAAHLTGEDVGGGALLGGAAGAMAGSVAPGVSNCG